MIHSPIQDPATLSIQEAIEAQNWTIDIMPSKQEPAEDDRNLLGPGWIVF